MDFKGYLFLIMFWIANAIYTLRIFILYYGVVLISGFFWTIPNWVYLTPLYALGAMSSILFLVVVYVANLGRTFEFLTGIGSDTKTTITIQKGEINIEQE